MNYLKILLFTFFSVFILVSCKDDNGVPITEKPIMNVTATESTAPAMEPVVYSIDATGKNSFSKLTVEETYGGKKKLVLDSTFNPPKSGLMLAYTYVVPDTATQGQTISLLFTITDVNGNSAAQTKTLTVSGSRPKINLAADKTEASQNDTVNFSAAVSSPLPNLNLLEISESINGTLGSVIKQYNFPANTKNTIYNYGYIIPASLQSGQKVTIIFKVLDKNGAFSQASKTITIK